MLFRSNDTATTEIYPLSLHDALPILMTASIATIALTLVSTAVSIMVSAMEIGRAHV